MPYLQVVMTHHLFTFQSVLEKLEIQTETNVKLLAQENQQRVSTVGDWLPFLHSFALCLVAVHELIYFVKTKTAACCLSCPV